MTPFRNNMPKKEQIRRMFDEIAPTYDRLNHIMSLDVDRRWRRRALRYIADGTAQQILDVACGTGDSTIAIARAAAPGSRIIGSDISEGMMRLVSAKAEAAGVADRITLEQADCEALPHPDAVFDRVACAFGVRNFEHKDRALAEMHRVLKPGGRVVILELSVPRNPVLRWVYGLYFRRILPRIGGAVSGDAAAYRYLPASVYAFPPPAAFCALLADAGFSAVRHHALTLGLCRLFVGEKPSGAAAGLSPQDGTPKKRKA